MLTNPRDAFSGQSRSIIYDTIRQLRYGFLLVSYSNFVPKMHRFENNEANFYEARCHGDK